MAQTIYFYQGYNSYFNRKLKNEIKTTSDLNIEELVYVRENVNIPINDGINTSIVFNLSSTDVALYQNLQFCDYAVIVEYQADKTFADMSHWFIMKIEKTIGSQYKIFFRRDLLVDNLDNVLHSTTFVEKGYVDKSNPLLYNPENMTFNEIKKAEQKISPFSSYYGQCPFIVAYISRTDSGGQEYSETIQASAPTTEPYIEYTSLPQPIKDLIDGTTQYYEMGAPENIFIDLNINEYSQLETYSGYCLPLISMDFVDGVINSITNEQLVIAYNNPEPNKVNANIQFLSWEDTNIVPFLTNIANGITKSTFKNYFIGQVNNASFDTTPYMSGQGVLVKLPDTTFIRISLSKNQGTKIAVPMNNNNAYQLDLEGAITRAGAITGNLIIRDNGTTIHAYDGNIYAYANRYTANVQSVVGNAVELVIPTTRTHTFDSPYDIIAIPYTNDLAMNGTNEQSIVASHTSKTTAMQIAMNLSRYLGERLYDIQLVPYIPKLYSYMEEYQGIDQSADCLLMNQNMTENVQFNYIKDNQNNIYGVAFFLPTSQDELRMTYPKLSSTYFDSMKTAYKNEATYHKVHNETIKYRIVSPNYNGMFEFSVDKNGRSVNYYNVRITLKPFNPFIQVGIDFKGLYQSDYKDSRGLICGGDFSLPVISNAWTNYELNNKYYQAIFDRQIAKMDFDREVQRDNQVFGMITTGLGGLVGGATATAKYGAVGGAVAGIGTIGALTKEMFNYSQSEKTYAEAKDYAIDNFNFNLGTIKARPESLTRVSSFNVINKIFPFVETYSCTSQERDVFVNKLTMNGFTINAITNDLTTYMNPDEESFIKGSVIRFKNDLDNFTATELATEIRKGFYINIKEI